MFTAITEYFFERRPLLTNEVEAEARDEQEAIILLSTLALDVILVVGCITLAALGCTGGLPLPVGITFSVLAPIEGIITGKFFCDWC